MICNDCQEAGRANSEALATEVTADRKRHFERALELHEQCLGNTHCNCHHRIGAGHINRDNEGNAVSSTS